ARPAPDGDRLARSAPRRAVVHRKTTTPIAAGERPAFSLRRSSPRAQPDGSGRADPPAGPRAHDRPMVLAQPARPQPRHARQPLPVPGACRAYDLRLAGALRRGAYRLPWRLPARRARVLPAERGGTGRALPAIAKQGQPRLLAGVDQAAVAVPRAVRAASAVRQPLAEHPGNPHAPRWAVLRVDEPGLPVGPGHELRGGDGPEYRPHDAGGCGAVGWSSAKCRSPLPYRKNKTPAQHEPGFS